MCFLVARKTFDLEDILDYWIGNTLCEGMQNLFVGLSFSVCHFSLCFVMPIKHAFHFQPNRWQTMANGGIPGAGQDVSQKYPSHRNATILCAACTQLFGRYLFLITFRPPTLRNIITAAQEAKIWLCLFRPAIQSSCGIAEINANLICKWIGRSQPEIARRISV